MKKKAIYAGSYDPITNGHLWIIKQAVELFDEVVVAIGENPDKKYTFSFEDRMYTLSELLQTMPDASIGKLYKRIPSQLC